MPIQRSPEMHARTAGLVRFDQRPVALMTALASNVSRVVFTTNGASPDTDCTLESSRASTPLWTAEFQSALSTSNRVTLAAADETCSLSAAPSTNIRLCDILVASCT